MIDAFKIQYDRSVDTTNLTSVTNMDAIFSAVILPALLIALGIGLAALAAAAVAASLNSSGRGLDTDEWEVDHSVWMNQLQKDFESSWAEN